MTRETEDDSLRWEGDDDPTLAPGWKTVGPSATAATGARGAAASDAPRRSEGAASSAEVDAGTDAVDDDTDDDDTDAGHLRGEATRQTGEVELVVLGILAGVYLLYTIGWLITALRTSVPGVSIVGDAMYGLGLWLAVLAAPCWFALALRSSGRRARLVWLIAGAVVLAPLPFILGVTA